MKTYKNHPLAEIFPMMEDQKLEHIIDDIQTNGLREPIILLDQKILDGRNRYKACQISGVDPVFSEFDSGTQGDPLSYVISRNLHRRHLSESQRAIIASKLTGLNSGRGGISQREAAEKMNVSRDSVQKAKRVLLEAPKKSVKQVEDGDKSINKALKEIKEKEEPREVFDSTDHPVPDCILEDWLRAEKVKSLMSQLSSIRCQVKDGIENDIVYAELSNADISDFNQCYTHLKQALPFAVCPTCQGVNRKKCTTCKQKGFLSEFRWKQCVPSEIKEMRMKARKK